MTPDLPARAVAAIWNGRLAIPNPDLDATTEAHRRMSAAVKAAVADPETSPEMAGLLLDQAAAVLAEMREHLDRLSTSARPRLAAASPPASGKMAGMTPADRLQAAITSARACLRTHSLEGVGPAVALMMDLAREAPADSAALAQMREVIAALSELKPRVPWWRSAWAKASSFIPFSFRIQGCVKCW